MFSDRWKLVFWHPQFTSNAYSPLRCSIATVCSPYCSNGQLGKNSRPLECPNRPIRIQYPTKPCNNCHDLSQSSSGLISNHLTVYKSNRSKMRKFVDMSSSCNFPLVSMPWQNHTWLHNTVKRAESSRNNRCVSANWNNVTDFVHFASCRIWS